MSPFLFAFVAIELLAVAWIDLKHKTISNRWHLVNFLLAIGLYLALPETYQLKWEVLLFPVAYVLVGFFLFLAGIMGAGDSKFLASLCLLLPLEFQLPFFEYLVGATLIIGGSFLLYRLFRDRERVRAYLWTRHWQGIKLIIKSEFSYAPVILLAWVFLGVKQWT